MSTAELVQVEAVRRVAAALHDGPDAWLVGGVVRDALLDRALHDVDVAVAGDPEQAARAIAREVRGPVFQLSEEFGAWRAIDGDRRFTCDVSRLQGDSIESDLARRDFTVNAIAVPLGGGDAIDPHHGIGDLRRGVLRVLGGRAYDEDPLRTLRMARLATELELEPDAETERLTRSAAPRLAEPAPERVFAELRRIVAAPRATEGIELAHRTGTLGVVLPELVELEGIEQSRFHHRDVYGHTIEVLARLIEVERDPSQVFDEHGAAVAAVLDEPLADDLTRGEALRLAALFHDIAKPRTRGERPDGRVTFIGHDSVGDEMVGESLGRLRASQRLRAYVGKLTREHLALGFMVHERPLARRALHGYLRRCDPVEVEVTLLSCADRMATRGEGQERWIDAHLELARDVMGPALQWRSSGPPPLPIRGDELARELGIEPGPKLGALLADLEAAVFAGEVEGKREAVDSARRVLESEAPR